MKKWFICLFLLIGITGCSVWEEAVHQRKENLNGQVKQIDVKVNNVDLIFKKSKDNQVHVEIVGTKAKIDQWDFTAFTKGESLEISSSYNQKMYLNFNDQAKRKLIISLPQKRFDAIRVSVAYSWETTVTVLDQTYTSEQLQKLKEQPSPFGTIQFVQ